MKKLITLALIAGAFTASAQTQSKNSSNQLVRVGLPQTTAPANRGTANSSGLLIPASFGAASPCLSTIAVYAISTGDRFTGNNRFGDREIMMRYDLAAYNFGLPATVDTIEALFGFKKQVGNGGLRAKVYAVDASTGGPGTLLGTSSTIAVSQVDVSGNKLTKFTFASPVTLTTSKFFVALDVSSIYATADTVAMVSTSNTCASAIATDAAWTRASDNNYYKLSDANNGWGFSADVMIFPSITTAAVGVNNVVTNNFSATVYPVPANGNITIAFEGQDDANTRLVLKDITGKVITSFNVQTTKGASYKVPFDVSNLSGGLYFVEIASGSNRGMLKVAVQ